MQALQQRVPDPSLSQVDIVKILTQGEMVRCVKPKLRDHAWQEIQVGEQMCAREEKEVELSVAQSCPSLCDPMD